jgi:DNA-binding response OmpR family regulator
MAYEKVLIVEDEPVVRNVLNEIFIRRKCTVSMAANLSEAEALVSQELFDLMMLDIRLPDGDGTSSSSMW